VAWSRPGRNPQSESGAKKIDTFDVSDLTSRIACVIPRGDGAGGTFNPDQWMEPKDQRKVDDFIIFAMCAARQALDDANWHPSTEEDRCATGTMIGSGSAACPVLPIRRCFSRSVARARYRILHSGASDQPCLGLCVDRARPQGPQPCGGHRLFDRAHAIGDAGGLIALGDADVDGGWRNGITNLPAIDGRILRVSRAIDRLQRCPGKKHRVPTKGSRRFCDGEGAGIVVLEEYEHAKKRGARMYAEVIGYGLSVTPTTSHLRRRTVMARSAA